MNLKAFVKLINFIDNRTKTDDSSRTMSLKRNETGSLPEIQVNLEHIVGRQTGITHICHGTKWLKVHAWPYFSNG